MKKKEKKLNLNENLVVSNRKADRSRIFVCGKQFDIYDFETKRRSRTNRIVVSNDIANPSPNGRSEIGDDRTDEMRPVRLSQSVSKSDTNPRSPSIIFLIESIFINASADGQCDASTVIPRLEL